MVKCSIDDTSLKQIKNMTARVLRAHLKEHGTASALKSNMKQLIQDISEQFELTDSMVIAQAISDAATRYGVNEQIPDYFNAENINNILIASDQDIQQVDPLEASTDQLTDVPQIKSKLDASRDFMDKSFGLAKEVEIQFQNITNQNLFDCLFINRGSINQKSGIVQNTKELNDNIRSYQTQLLKNITTYLRSVLRNARNLKIEEDIKKAVAKPVMYDENNKYTGILEVLRPLIDTYIREPLLGKTDIIREVYNTSRDSNSPDSKLSKQKLDAFNSMVLLRNFDTYLSVLLGKAIQIKDFNQKTGEDKYQISDKTAKLATTWRVSENIFVEDEADAITKLAINTSPLYNWGSTVPKEGYFLNFSNFQHIIAKIKDLTYNTETDKIIFDKNFGKNYKDLYKEIPQELKDKSLRSFISMVRRNPRKYLHSIFDILSNDNFKKDNPGIYKNFTQDELNKLYSLSKDIFNGSNSLRNLVSGNPDIDYYAFVTQSADSIFNVRYIQYYQDEDGKVQVRTLLDQGINNVKRKLEQTINVSNSITLIGNWESYKSSLGLTASYENDDLKSITFKIPGTDIVAEVLANSGDVRLTGNINYVQDLQKLLPFIDKTLRMNLQNNMEFLNSLKETFGSTYEVGSNLLKFASRVIFNQYVSKEILTDAPTSTRQDLISMIYGRNAPSYNWELDELGMVHGNDIRTLNLMALAKANMDGITTATQVKDGEGNGQSNQTLSRLLGSLTSQWELQERQKDSISNSFQLLTTPGLLEGIYTAKEFYNPSDRSKSTTAMNVNEMAYSQVVYDFIGGLMERSDNNVVGNGHIMILPSVNSDKGTIGRLKIDLNTPVYLDGIQKPLKDFTSSELKRLISQEFGEFYENMYYKVISDWATLEDYMVHIGYPVKGLLASDFINGFKNFNQIFPSLNTGFKTPVEFVKSIVLDHNSMFRLHPLELVDQVHYKNVKGNLAINPAIIAQVARFKPESLIFQGNNKQLMYPSSEQFWIRKKAEVLKGLLKSNFRINVTESSQPELKFIEDNYKGWINTSGDVILAKANINGNLIDIASSKDLLKLGIQGNINDVIDGVSSTLQLNPILEQYNYLDYLVSQEFMDLTVGSFVAHPEKSKSADVLQQEAAHFQAQHKRNVSFTAAMHTFQLNLLNGIPEYYNLAVIDDIHDTQGTIIGLDNDIKPFDGATFVNPFVVILENNSLGGARAGISKKQFVHFKNETTGTGGIIKTAGFGLTNDWIRNSPFLERMMRKMTDHIWLNEDNNPFVTDITKNWKGDKINYKKFFFKRNGKTYQITNIESLGNNTYRRTIQEVTLDGNPIGKPLQGKNIVIDSNYKLWNFFGGKDSMELKNGKLLPSNTSVENVVLAMNNIGTPKNNNIQTQDDIWQALKMSDVHYLATAGAVKQGAANINSASRYNDDVPYDTQRIHMYQSGIQLDKEHHADEAELSLMTQVISACAAKGYTIDTAIGLYDALRKSTDINTKEHLQAVQELFADGSEESIQNFQEILMQSIVKAISTSNGDNFAKTIALDLMEQAKAGKKISYADVNIPLSDNNIYRKVFSTVSSFLTRSGIKQKIPGVLSVLTPSHEIMKVYAGRKYESFTNPKEELAELQKQQAPVYDSRFTYTKDQKSFMGFNLIQVEYKSMKSKLDGQPVAARNMHDGNIYLDVQLLADKYREKAWQKARNSEPLNYDFKSPEEWINFVLLHEAMHNQYLKKNGESSFDYETRINNEALKRLPNDITNLELGRTYLITYNVDSEVEDVDGNLQIVPVPVTEPKPIRTPREYRQLKKDIQSGKVTQVIEDVRDGRNLAGYNVRFRTDKGSFQIWDLTSASALFDINEIEENWEGTQQDVDALKQVMVEAYGSAPNITLENASTYLSVLKIRLRRQLQSDLQNLSKTTPNVIEQYKQLVTNGQNTREWFNKYAQWVNIKLGRNDGSSIKLNGVNTVVDAANFRSVHMQVLNLLKKSQQVRIDGDWHTVDKNSLREQAYEVIMPKTFATKFGLREFDDLNTIQNDRDYFIKQYLKNQATKVNPQQYSIEFKRADGNHLYVLNKKRVPGSQLKKLSGIVTSTDEEGNVYRLDANGNTLYKITSDTEIYTDSLGNEVIVSDDLEHYINELKYDSVKLSENLIDFPSIIDSTCKALRKSVNKNARSFGRYIMSGGNTAQDILGSNEEYHSVTLENYQQEPDTNPIIRAGREKHTSFLRSLDIVAARIPAQSMQSYMPMKIIAFDNPDINTAYVSTYQILLQGSDYDVDAVSLATFDIDANGILQLWSPYADLANVEMRKASENLPIPTGEEVEIQESDNINECTDLFKKYGDLFNIRVAQDYDKKTGEYTPSNTEVAISLNINTPEQLSRFGQMLKEIKVIHIPSNGYIPQFMKEVSNLFVIKNREQFNSIFQKLKEIVDHHNLYLDRIDKDKLSTIVNNYTMMSMYNTIIDPVNLIQAQTSVDGTTGPLKAETKKSAEGKEAKNRTPGNFVNKYQSIVENQVGKEAIAICATGLKAFFGLTQYNNWVLNYGTSEQQSRLLLNSTHQGHIIGGKVYKTLANIRSKDPNTITNADVLEALSQVTNDNDAALTLSALLSLATDNAKELALSKLNASTKTIGMYIYGITIGMDFKDVAKILMSPTGSIVTSLLEGDVFTGKREVSQPVNVFGYFEQCPKELLNKYDVHQDPEGNTIPISPLQKFSELFRREQKLGKEDDLGKAIATFGKSGYIIQEKLNSLESLRGQYNSPSKYAQRIYNQLIDSIEEYVINLSNIDEKVLSDLRTLAEGAKEMRRLGSIFSLNQGIKNDPEGLLRQVNLIERAIYDITEDEKDIIDINKFAFDEAYRQRAINAYEKVKHSFNILEAVSTVPHFMGYVQTLAIALREVSESFKFRSSRNMSLELSTMINYKDENRIIKGIENFVGDFLRKQWLLQNDVQMIIPKGNQAFDKQGNKYILAQDTPVHLGTDWGAATFRMFMESQVIPDLKAGKIKPGVDFPGVKDNRFIKDLMNDLSTNTVSRNASIIYTLPINMLPRTDADTATLNAYKAEFNKLAKYAYQYEVTTFNPEGQAETTLSTPKPLVDLFTYYAMIANNWKLSENSLVPILENFQNTGILQDFHNFEKAYDKSEYTLSLDKIDIDDILPYVAPKGSPYSSYSNYLWARNSSTHKYEMMRKLSNEELDSIQEDENGNKPGVINRYQFRGSSDTNYFPTGSIQQSEKVLNASYKDGEDTVHYQITYDVESGKIIKAQSDSVEIDLSNLKSIPTTKVNGIRKVDTNLLESIIKDKLNPC